MLAERTVTLDALVYSGVNGYEHKGIGIIHHGPQCRHSGCGSLNDGGGVRLCECHAGYG
jgi:hypothetical protein